MAGTRLLFPGRARGARLAVAALCAALWGCGSCQVRPPPDGGVPDAGPQGACAVTFKLRPSVTATTVQVLGEWDGFDRAQARAMTDDGTGGYSAELWLDPGTYGYVFLVNGAQELDPANGDVRYVDGKPTSRLLVSDCLAPSLAVVPPVEKLHPAPGQGTFHALVKVTAPLGTDGLSVSATVRLPGDHVTASYQPRALLPTELVVSADKLHATVDLTGLADGKYTVAVRATQGARRSQTLLLPFWVEAQPFSFRDSALYMAMIDRFRDGDTANNPARQAGVPLSADFQGGDLPGLEQAINEGYFDDLGVRALWLSPWQTQPSGNYPDTTQAHLVTGYHGYWPIKAREVDPRLGGADALHRVVEAAHRHGIRVVMDTVLNHVHQEHEYFQDPAKKGWFRTGCVCGGANCDWDGHRLDCLFTPYLPDVNWTVGDAADQMLSDVEWWVTEFDLDGLRVDAVKHVEDSAITGLSTRMRQRFTQAGNEFFMFGETFSADYALINHSIGPTALDAQLDFPLFLNVPGPAFSRDDQGLLHAKYWAEQSESQFKGAPMVKFIGNHDVPRFITTADPANAARAGNQWDNLPGWPVGQDPYDRLYMALFYAVTLPGVPLVFYGDEYGEFGGSDPDNRHFANRVATFSTEQASQFGKTKKLLLSRGKLRGLARGPLASLWCNSDDGGKGNLWAYSRADSDPRQTAVVVLNRTTSTWTGVVLNFPPGLGWGSGTVYDLLSGNEWSVSNHSTTVNVPPRGGVILGLR